MQSIAHAHFARFSAQKVNQVLQLVRRKPVVEALKILQFVPKKSSLLVAKTIKSAAANWGDRKAQNPNLVVDQAWVGQGPALKRLRAYAMGRGFTYKRKTCHLTVVVAEAARKKAALPVSAQN